MSALLTLSCSGPENDRRDTLSIDDFLSSVDSAAFSLADEIIEFEFPRDHGQHPDFRNEWWYLTGNLQSGEGRHFGFQFTLFRNALAPGLSTGHPSRWSTQQTYLAHIAVSDVEGEQFHADERFARGALGLAGVQHDPFRAWLEDWQLTQDASRRCSTCFAVELSAAAEGFGFELHLESDRPPVLHGDSGLSRKGEVAGNASYYYSYTRLNTQGELRVGGERYQVRGTSWMDHEWSTSSLRKDQAGWDWFSVQLSDGSDLMLFQIRHRDDPGKHYLYGTFVAASEEVNTLDVNDFDIATTGSWTSPVSGSTYPAGWRIEIPRLDMELHLEPLLQNQEMNLSFRYWEGAVRASGTRNSRRVSGRGYVELTGY